MTHKIIDDCIEAIENAIESALEYDAQASDAATSVDTNDGYIDCIAVPTATQPW